jgi:hypothetical protein
MNLSPEQQLAADELLKFRKPEQTLGGFAGTGKSTLVKYLTDRLDFKVCTPTGKAASVLKSKNVEANTIHSTIYFPVVDSIGKLVQYSFGNAQWKLKDDLNVKGFIVDEASMVSRSITCQLFSLVIMHSCPRSKRRVHTNHLHCI